MKKRYTEMMEHIYPTQEQKNSMLEKVFEPEPEKAKRGFKIKYCIPAVALAVIFSTTVFAEEIKNTFYGLLGKNEIVSEEVLNDVYTDTGEHVSIAVKEVLSDMINCRMIVEYTLHDEIGREWIDNLANACKSTFLEVSPHMKEENTILYGVSRSYGCEELTEYRTENTRVFNVFYESSGEGSGTNSVDLMYHLYHQWENHAVIDVSKSVQLTDIKLDSSLAPNFYYKPIGVKISPMSILIYGQNCGLYETGNNKYGGYYIRSLVDDDFYLSSLHLIMKDGNKYDLLHDEEVQYAPGWGLGSVTNADLDYDVSVYCSALRDIDITTIDGIELDGVYYSFDGQI
ncbi:MAG: hypothetical protein NC320_05735 [Clostridium sp.]|nr:hypothetical protein [Clostridium sp.]MCM1547455.1 hypothetical protein [Ruminococcus sp.]